LRELEDQKQQAEIQLTAFAARVREQAELLAWRRNAPAQPPQLPQNVSLIREVNRRGKHAHSTPARPDNSMTFRMAIFRSINVSPIKRSSKASQENRGKRNNN